MQVPPFPEASKSASLFLLKRSYLCTMHFLLKLKKPDKILQMDMEIQAVPVNPSAEALTLLLSRPPPTHTMGLKVLTLYTIPEAS